MAKRVVEREEAKVAPKCAPYELSAVSEYYIYGRGDAEYYDRSKKAVKEDIRSAAYGERKPVVEESVKKKGKACNGSCVAAVVLSLLTIAIYVIGKFLATETLPFVDGADGIGLIAGFFTSADGIAFGANSIGALLLTASAVCVVLSLAVSLIRICAKRTGWLLRTVAALAFLCSIGATAAYIACMKTPETGLIAVCLSTLGTLIAASVNKNK
ncbi:MAG: hypothetical protein ACI4SK_03815 [Christensenellales bacterium]